MAQDTMEEEVTTIPNHKVMVDTKDLEVVVQVDMVGMVHKRIHISQVEVTTVMAIGEDKMIVEAQVLEATNRVQ